MSAESPLLVLERVRVAFHGNVVLDLDHFEICDGSPGALLLMGPNGAGKTTLLNAVTGYVPVTRGAQVRLNSGKGWDDLTHLAPEAVVRQGVARTFQSPLVFPSLTVRETMLLTGLFGLPRPWYGRWLGLRWRAKPAVTSLVERLLKELRLESVADLPQGQLPLALLRRAELARCLSAQPRLVFLDEPTAGADNGERELLVRFLGSELPGVIGELHAAGLYRNDRVSVCVITHDLPFTRRLREANTESPPFVHVLSQGRLLLSETLDKVMGSPAVQRLYLGGG